MKKNLITSLLHIKKYLMVFLFCAGLSITLFAQDSKGTEFWICFPGNLSNLSPQLYIAGSATTASVTVAIPGLAFSQTVTVPAGGLQVIDLPATAQVQSQFAADAKGIHITASSEVTVYGMNAQTATTDAYLAFPLDAIGREYYVMAYFRDFSNLIPTQATVLATQNNTTITITSSITDGPFTAGVPSTVTLQQGEVYQIRSTIVNADYTGTKITANNPISVFGGAQCTNISGTLRACDHLVEQLPPLSTWGRSFLTVPLATRLAGDVFRFLAQTNGTAVSVNGSVVANLNAGQFFETILSSTSYNRVTSTQPILVGQYSRSSQADNVVSDPFFALVPPDEQFLNSYVVSAGTSNIPNNYLNITSPTSNIGTVRVDGTVVNPGLWVSIPSTTFSGAKVPVSTGVHSVTSTLPVGLLAYGFGSFDSYGYIGGQSFSEVARVSTVTLAPKGATSIVNVNQCFTATVRDQFNALVPGVRVDFAITGPNSSSTGFAIANASGVATFCYTGTNPGTDNITASVGGLADATTFVWKPAATCTASITASGSLSLCAGESVTLTASAGTSYMWSNGATSQSIVVTGAGNYSVTVKTGTSCSATSPVTVVTLNRNCGGGAYCTAKGSCKTKGYINQVYICPVFNNVSGWNNGYGDFLNIITNTSRGSSLLLGITPGFDSYCLSDVYIRVWIDWNGNGDFTDAGEEVFSPAPTRNRVKTYVTVPANAKLGKTRMRVILRQDAVPTSCGNFTYGEVEDYTISINANRSSYSQYSLSSLAAWEKQADESGNIIQVYPNPAYNNLVVERSGFDAKVTAASPAQIVIADAGGKQVLQKGFSGLVQSLDVSKLANGIYFVTIKTQNSITTKKIIIRH